MVIKLLIPFLFSFTLAKAEVTAELSESRIQQSESVKLIVNATSDTGGDRTSEPTFTAPDFEVASNFSSLSQSSAYVNGKFEFQVIRTYTFVLFPKKSGNLQISNIKMTVGEKEVRLPDLAIRVLEEGANANAPGSGGGVPSTSGSGQDKESEEDGNNTRIGEDFLIRSVIEPKSVYVGQRINTDYYFYKRKEVSSFDLPVIPKFESFWRETVMFAKTFNWQKAKLGNYYYDRSLISSYALYPLKAGKLSIDPMTSRIIYHGTSSGDDIFGGIFQLTKRMRKDVTGGAAEIEVKELPTENQPSNFYKGLVGNLKISASIDKQKVEVNKPITLTLITEGTVNLNALDIIGIQYPKHLEVYDPKIYSDIDYKNSQRKFEILIIPRSGGKFTLPEWKFSVFDPLEKKYVEVSSPELQFEVDGPILAEQSLAEVEKNKANPNTPEVFSVTENDKTYYYFRLVLKIVSSLFALAFLWFLVKTTRAKVKSKRDELYRYEIWLKKIQKEKNLQKAYLESFNWIVSLINKAIPTGLSTEDKISEFSEIKLKTEINDYYRLLEKRQFGSEKTDQSREDLEKIIKGLRNIKQGIEKWKKSLI